MNKNFVDMPIDPESLKNLTREQIYHPDAFAKDHPGTDTQCLWIKPVVFIAIMEIARLICEGTRWDKKSRIILEYDPEAEKFAIATVMKSDDTVAENVQENV